MGSDIEIVVEPGRRVIGDTAILLTAVQNIKNRGGTVWLAIDAGFNTLLDAINVKWYFHVIVANKSDKEHASPFRLAGPLCDGGDAFFDIDGEATMNTLLKKIPDLQKYRREIQSLMVRLPRHRLFPKPTKPDDIIAFLDVGAYTLEQMSQYNGRQRSGAVMITADRTAKRIRRRDSTLDLLTNDLMWG
jgi:diaminopimelate decarboxylase